MKRAPAVALPALAVLAFALGGCHSAKSDFYTICHAAEHAGEPGVDPSMRAMRTAEYIRDNIHTREARKFFGELAMATDGKTRADMLRAEAAAHGVSPCPLADENP